MIKKLVFIAVLAVASMPVLAENPVNPVNSVFNTTPTALNPGAPVLNTAGYYLQDVNSGAIVASQNPDVKVAPASLTKLMTLYLTFEALQAGRIHLNENVTISKNAWQTGGSRMFVTAGSQVPVSDLIQGVIVDSGNDACTALAQFVGGNQAGFVNLMNQQAQLLGMKNTHYADVTGLPSPLHYSTPRDLAILARAIILNFPQYYHFFAEKTFTYDNITQPNRNRLLWSDPSVDGLKTGHTDEAGYCLIASANRNGMRLLSVILGAPTDADRSQYSESLLNYGYHFFETHKIYTANQILKTLPVYYGKTKTVSVGVLHDVYLTVPVGQYATVSEVLNIKTPLHAPVQKNQVLGMSLIKVKSKTILSESLVALDSVQKGGLFTRLISWVKLKI